MFTRGFARGRMAALGISCVTMVAATGSSVAENGQWTGPYIGFETAFVDAFIDYQNTGTPEQNLEGFMFGLAGGYDVQVGKVVVGIAGDALLGNLNDFVRDGNYITESGEIKALGSIRGRIGVERATLFLM